MFMVLGLVIAFFIAFLGFIVFIDVGNGWGPVLCIIAGIATLVITGRLQRKREQNDSNERLNKIMTILNQDGFESSQYFITQTFDKAFAIDEESKKIRFLENQSGDRGNLFRKYTFQITDRLFKDILQVEVLEDDVPIRKSSEDSLAYDGESTNKVSKLQLRVVVDDKHKSSLTLTFIQFESPVSKDNDEYLVIRERVQEAYDYIEEFLKIHHIEERGQTDDLVTLASKEDF
ncbi:hypothetical protein [Bacillus sp. NPDC077027]|uniref:hypothetical protein n=1 Tax=Bacillus sp. NPDC077027 TaxID=3390548 RepID=UPI003D024672